MKSIGHSRKNDQTARHTAKRLVYQSVSPNTQRAYTGQLSRLHKWLQGRDISDSTLAEYVGWLYECGYAPPTANQAIAACKFEARMAGFPNPVGALTKQALAGFLRDPAIANRGRGQAFGICAHKAEEMARLASEDRNSMRGLRDAAIILVMSDAMMRVSEVAALRIDDLTENEDGSGRLVIRQSKTDPKSQGTMLYLGPPTLKRCHDWLIGAALREGRMFRRILRGGHVQANGLTPKSVHEIIKGRAAAAGIVGKRVTGQSLRVGMAQTLATAGASLGKV